MKHIKLFENFDSAMITIEAHGEVPKEERAWHKNEYENLYHVEITKYGSDYTTYKGTKENLLKALTTHYGDDSKYAIEMHPELGNKKIEK